MPPDGATFGYMNANSLTVTAQINAKPDKESQVRQELLSLVAPTCVLFSQRRREARTRAYGGASVCQARSQRNRSPVHVLCIRKTTAGPPKGIPWASFVHGGSCRPTSAPLRRLQRVHLDQHRFLTVPGTGATRQAAEAKRHYALRNASRSALSWSLCVSATPCEAPG
jgi:hypothetical protein